MDLGIIITIIIILIITIIIIIIIIVTIHPSSSDLAVLARGGDTAPAYMLAPWL